MASKNKKLLGPVQALHVPNLIIRLCTRNIRRMNQLSSTVLYLGRPCRSIQSIDLNGSSCFLGNVNSTIHHTVGKRTYKLFLLQILFFN